MAQKLAQGSFVVYKLVNGDSIFVTYHDNPLDNYPAAPVGNGSTNGWHRTLTSQSRWRSEKVAQSESLGTWGSPVPMTGQDGAPTPILSLSPAHTAVVKSASGVLTPAKTSCQRVLNIGGQQEVIGVDQTINYKGRNLIRGSRPTTPFTGNSGKYAIGNWNAGGNYINTGQTYTILAELYCDEVFASSGSGIQFHVGGYQPIFPLFKPITPTVITTTFTATRDGYLNVFHMPNGSAGNSYINWVMLVEGDVAPKDWVAAPEDSLITFNGSAYTAGTEVLVPPSATSLTWELKQAGKVVDKETIAVVSDGKPGTDGKYTVQEYKVSATKPTGAGAATPPAVPSGQYLWMRTGVVTPPATTPATWSEYVKISGEKGETGSDGVKKPYYDYSFALSGQLTTANSSTTPVIMGTWSDIPPTTVTGKYAWIIVKKSDGTNIIPSEISNVLIEIKQANGVNLISNLPADWEQGSFGESQPAGSTQKQLEYPSAIVIRAKELLLLDDVFTIQAQPGFIVAYTIFDAERKYTGKVQGFQTWISTYPFYGTFGNYLWQRMRYYTVTAQNEWTTTPVASYVRLSGESGETGNDGDYVAYRYAINGSTIEPPLKSQFEQNEGSIPDIYPFSYCWQWELKMNNKDEIISWASRPVLTSFKPNNLTQFNTELIVEQLPFNINTWYFGSTYTVTAVEDSNGKWYISRMDCLNAQFYNIPLTNTAYWNPVTISADSIATNLLIAKETYIKNLGVERVKTANTGNRIEINGNTKIPEEISIPKNTFRLFNNTSNIPAVSIAGGGTDSYHIGMKVFNDGNNNSEITDRGMSIRTNKGTLAIDPTSGYDKISGSVIYYETVKAIEYNSIIGHRITRAGLTIQAINKNSSNYYTEYGTIKGGACMTPAILTTGAGMIVDMYTPLYGNPTSAQKKIIDNAIRSNNVLHGLIAIGVCSMLTSETWLGQWVSSMYPKVSLSKSTLSNGEAYIYMNGNDAYTFNNNYIVIANLIDGAQRAPHSLCVDTKSASQFRLRLNNSDNAIVCFMIIDLKNYNIFI